MALSRFISALQVFDAYPTLAGEMTAEPKDEPPAAYLTGLAASASPEDAITFCAYMLDKRQAVWWTTRCLRHMGSPRSHDEDIALKMAEVWVREPEEHRRVAALQIGFNGDHNLPPIWAALAAGCAGGTYKIDDLQGPPIPSHATASAARMAVLIALAAVPARERKPTIDACVAMARELLQPAERS